MDEQIKIAIRAVAALAAGASYAGGYAGDTPSSSEVVYRASVIADWIETGAAPKIPVGGRTR